MIARLGGALWTAVLALSAIITIVGALKLPEFVDSSNPWVLLGGAVIVFAIGFGNGYKQGKVRNEISAETEERIAQMRLDREAERRRLDADAAAERQRLKDESDAMIRREDEDRARRQKEEESDRRARQLEEQKRQADAEGAVSTFKTLAKLNDVPVMVCMAVLDHGGSMILSESLSQSIEEEDRYSTRMFDYTPKGGDSCEVSLREWVLLALESDDGLLLGYDQRDCERIEQALVEDAEQVARDRGDYDG